MLDAATSELEAATPNTHLNEPPVKLETASSQDAARTGQRILLVEDHEGVAKACRRLLMSHGHSVVCVPSVAAATDAAEETIFDVVICDLSLPDGSGIEVLERLKPRFARIGKAGELPAIAISGSVYEEDVARTLQAGFAAHLAKPFDEDGLINAVRSVTQLLDP
jgi:CheY-like chemotaxis protein